MDFMQLGSLVALAVFLLAMSGARGQYSSSCNSVNGVQVCLKCQQEQCHYSVRGANNLTNKSHDKSSHSVGGHTMTWTLQGNMVLFTVDGRQVEQHRVLNDGFFKVFKYADYLPASDIPRADSSHQSSSQTSSSHSYGPGSGESSYSYSSSSFGPGSSSYSHGTSSSSHSSSSSYSGTARDFPASGAHTSDHFGFDDHQGFGHLPGFQHSHSFDDDPFFHDFRPHREHEVHHDESERDYGNFGHFSNFGNFPGFGHFGNFGGNFGWGRRLNRGW